MVIPGSVRREGTAGCRKFGADAFFHHCKFHAGSPAHGVAGADALERAELAQSWHIRIKKPHAGRAGHGEDNRLGPENIKLPGVNIHAHGSDAPEAWAALRIPAFLLYQQRRCLRTVKDAYAELFKLCCQRRFEGAAPHAQRETVFIIVGKHQLCPVIPERSSLKFILRIPDLSSEAFQIQHAVVSFPAFNVMRNAVGIAILLIKISGRNFFRRHLRTRVGTGALPVVETCSGASASFNIPLFHKKNLLSAACCLDGGKAAGKAAAEYQHIRNQLLRLTHLIGIRPRIVC